MSEVIEGEERRKDPVCGMMVLPSRAREKGNTLLWQGEEIVFCNPKCKTRFEADPAAYAVGGHAADGHDHAQDTPAAAKDVLFTCPMDPQVRQIGPGACPICGMALEPLDPAAAQDDSEYRNMRRRFFVALVLSLPVLALAMSADIGSGPTRLRDWIECALCVPVVFWAGAPFFGRGWSGVRCGHANMFTLIGLGVGVAFGYSLVALSIPSVVPAAFRTARGAPPVYFEAAAVIITLVLLGQMLELKARARTGGAIRALLDLAPTTVRRRTGADSEDIPLEAVRVGDVLIVRPGDNVPVDGVLVEGQSAIDESLISGEPIPVPKAPGDTVTGGTLNGDGLFAMRAERIGAATMLAQIAAQVAEAQRSRAPMQSLADTVSAWFVPAVVGIAVLTFAIWLALGFSSSYALMAAISVLIIACPCALGLATPMSVMAAVGRGARAGVLVRNAESLERLAHAKVLVLDKTGTLTEGKPQLTAIVSQHVTEAQALSLAAALEAGSTHPLAHAVLEAANARNLQWPAAEGLENVSGEGLKARIDGQPVVLGRASFLRANGIDPSPLLADSLSSTIYLGRAGVVLARLEAQDRLKPDASAQIAALKKDGLVLVIASGDTPATATAIARQAGIARVEAGLSPQAKTELIKTLKHQYGVVAMAGDGINDAPALAAADVAIAMGTGADAAIKTAGLTLLGGELGALVRARKLARAAVRNMRQNLLFAFLYNAAGIPIAAGVLYPLTGFLLSPMIAAAAMSLSSVSVIASALRLSRLRL